MALDEKELKKGLKFIVGTWEMDFVVNFFSNNLEHIPAKEFKSQDGKSDFGQISYEFFEDHTIKLKNGANGIEETGTWKQESSSKFSFTCDKLFGDVPPEVLQKLTVVERDMEGGLVFSLLCFTFRMKKTADGVVTVVKKPDIGEIQPSAEDLKMKAIVGRWKVYKSMAFVGEDVGMFTRPEVEAQLDKDIAEGNLPASRRSDKLMAFTMIYEFTDDYKINVYTPIPPDVSKEEIEEAIASGEVKVVDGMIIDGDRAMTWKAVNGEYYYDSGEPHACGDDDDEQTTTWEKITPDSEGHMDFRMAILEKM